ncbi:uncharacterized protein ABDE67_022069 [Symphorus nematophorus]
MSIWICGYCRVLYSNLDQHLSSLRHQDSVRASSRGSSTVSSASRSRTKLSLLERFLQDVLQHHPHRYKDPRPSHADLPSVSAPLLPREELDELCFSDKDSRSPSNREHLPSFEEASCRPTNRREDNSTHSQAEWAVHERVSAAVSEHEEGGTAPPVGCTDASQAQAPPPVIQAPPTVHRKAHRKTNRRKTSESSSPPHRAPDAGPRPGPAFGPSPALTPGPSLTPGPGLTPGPHLGPGPARPWLSWQKQRREAHKEEAFSSDESNSVHQTIEEVRHTQ